MADPQQIEVPEDFGNDWMSNLEEIGVPDAVPFRPETPGWYLLAGLSVLVVLWLTWRLFKRWRANAYRREGLRELSEIEGLVADSSNRSEALQSLPELLKRVALVAYPRARVAELCGDAWLGFLDGTVGSTEFTQGVGRMLPKLSYVPVTTGQISDSEANDLISLAGSWIRHHRADLEVGDDLKRPAPLPVGVGAPSPRTS